MRGDLLGELADRRVELGGGDDAVDEPQSSAVPRRSDRPVRSISSARLRPTTRASGDHRRRAEEADLHAGRREARGRRRRRRGRRRRRAGSRPRSRCRAPARSPAAERRGSPHQLRAGVEQRADRSRRRGRPSRRGRARREKAGPSPSRTTARASRFAAELLERADQLLHQLEAGGRCASRGGSSAMISRPVRPGGRAGSRV